jgi:hypothetical protein
MRSGKKNKNDANVYYFRGAKLNKSEASQTFCAILFGVIGIIVAIAIFGTERKISSLVTIGVFTICGFVGYKYFSKKK